jgi:fructokinase
MAAGPFVVVGESLVDIVQPAGGEPVAAPGGSPLNVAVGLARLEVDTVLVTQLGDDEHGRLLAQHATGSAVRLSGSAVAAGRRTSTATARLDDDHVASYEFDLAWELERHRLPEGAVGLHVGSLSAVLRPGRDAVLDLLRQAEGRFVSYDPNVRPAFVTDPARTWRDVAEVAACARLVKCSEEDLAALRPGEQEPAVIAVLLAGAATELVVVTRGGRGATAYRDGLRVDVPGAPSTVVDTVGAGDSFMAALLAVLSDWELLTLDDGSLAALGEHRLALLLEGAAQAAAVTCSRRGANPPTRRELPPTWPAG